MALKIRYEAGDNLANSYFIASEEGKEDVAVRASHIVHPNLQKKAEDGKLAVTENEYIERFQKLCSDLDSFQRVALEIASNHAVQAAAHDQPTYATEPVKPQKAQAEPEVAAEQQYVEKAKDKGGDGSVRKYFAGLPAKSVGDPVRAVDVHSSEETAVDSAKEEVKPEAQPEAKTDEVVAPVAAKKVEVKAEETPAAAPAETSNEKALMDELAKVAAENEDLKGQLAGKAKEGEVSQVLELLTDIGLVEDEKDKEKYKKQLMGLNEPAIGVLETILKDVADCVGDMDGDKGPKAPKPPSAPGAAPKPPAGPPKGGMPPMGFEKKESIDALGNIPATPWTDPITVGAGVSDLSNLMLFVDRQKELAR